MTRRQKMSFRDAVDLVPDDLPDGAFWAMAHEMAGLDYGDGFGELAVDDEPLAPLHERKPHQCPLKGCRKRFSTPEALAQHRRDKHGSST
jgi:hypothetical protein